METMVYATAIRAGLVRSFALSWPLDGEAAAAAMRTDLQAKGWQVVRCFSQPLTGS